MEKIITALESQKNNSDRINVFLDGEFAFGVSRFVGAWLSVGQKIDEAKRQSLLQSDEKEKAYQSALRYIGYRQRTESEITKKLEQLDFDSEIINSVVGDLKEKGYIDDNEYAVQWIQIRSESKPSSKRFVQFELKRKGIAEDTINAALETAPDDQAQAIKLGKKYLNRFMNINDEDFRKKITGVLSRRAFSYMVIKDALNELTKLRIEEKFKE
jgi:regulatory protein